MTAILAIDPGAAIGWARSDWTCGTLDLTPLWRNDQAEALAAFAEWLTAQMPRTARLVIERPFGRSAFTSETPGIIAARAHEIAWRAGVARSEWTVSQIRKAVLGKGNAPKSDVAPFVKAAGWPVASPHAADACLLMMAEIERAKP